MNCKALGKRAECETGAIILPGIIMDQWIVSPPTVPFQFNVSMPVLILCVKHDLCSIRQVVPQHFSSSWLQEYQWTGKKILTLHLP